LLRGSRTVSVRTQSKMRGSNIPPIEQRGGARNVCSAPWRV